jgi:hypothetical protein
MDFAWLADLTPLQIAELIGGIALLILVAKYAGLSYSKEKGLHFKTKQISGDILETVKAIRESDARQEAVIKMLSETVSNNTKDVLRLTFYNTALSPAERLVAGKRYRACGGNGETEKAIRELAAEYPATWEAIIAVSAKREVAP